MENVLTPLPQLQQPKHKKSKMTLFIEAVNNLRYLEFDQYRATMFIMDAIHGTNDLPCMQHKTLRGAKGNLKRAFGVGSLMEYIETKDLIEIEPFLASTSDFICIKDEGADEHDDIAFCTGTRWMYFDDKNALNHDRFSLLDYDLTGSKVKAYRFK